MFRSTARLTVRIAPKEPAGLALTVEPAWKIKALRAAELTLRELGVSECGGHLEISSETPVGWGFGSSTSDVIAAIRAVAAAFGVRMRNADTARIAVAAECASDSTMFDDRAVVFAQRSGDVVEDLGGTLPPLVVFGFTTDASGRGVDTIAHPPADYSWLMIEQFRPLLGLLRRAVRDQDPRILGRVATASAHINQHFLPKPRLDEIGKLAEEHGAVGIQVAHSGTIAGIMFDAAAPLADDEAARLRQQLAVLGFHQSWRFATAEL